MESKSGSPACHDADRARQQWARTARREFAEETGQRQAEHPVEVRLVSVPAYADTNVVLGAKDLANLGACAAESFDVTDISGRKFQPSQSQSRPISARPRAMFPAD
jgi:hypothetical protein